MRGTAVRVATLLLACILHATAASAHQQLIATAPASGDTLSVAPGELRLTFTQPIPTGLAQLRLLGPAGEVALGPFFAEDAAGGVLRASIQGGLPPGDYIVHWLVTGDDGHAVRGELGFHLPATADGVATTSAESAAPEPASAFQEQVSGAPGGAGAAPAVNTGSPLLWAIRWLNLSGIIVLIGAAATGALLLRGFRRRAGPTGQQVFWLAIRRTAVAGLVAALALLIALALRLWAQAATLAGPAGIDRSLVEALLRESLWGTGWLVQLGGVVLAALGFAIGRRATAGWWVAAVGAIAVAISPALSGHAAATSTAAMVADSAHVLAAGGWLGTLFVMMTAALPAAFRADPLGRNHPTRMLAAFSPLALLFALLLVGSGVYMATLHLPGPEALWTTAYGRLLLAKLVLLGGVLLAGAYNWRRSRPQLERGGRNQSLHRIALVELFFAAVVIAVTASLVATPLPGHTTEGEVGAASATGQVSHAG